MAQVLPFPLTKRRDLIWRQARFYTDQKAKAAETNLAHQLKVQADALIRKGVDPAAAEAQVQALEGAIRATVWRLVLTPGGAA